MADSDFTAQAARRQGELAESLRPFKLVFSDGDESLGSDDARGRIHWVGAIGDELQRTKAHKRGPPSARGSVVSGSSSARYSLGDEANVIHTSDDAVIATAGGFTAPLSELGSRRLATGAVERVRSLRRVASDTDVREQARGETTVAAARSQPSPSFEQQSLRAISPPAASEADTFSTASSFRHASAAPTARETAASFYTASSVKASSYRSARSPQESPVLAPTETHAVATGELFSPATEAKSFLTAQSERGLFTPPLSATTSRTMFSALGSSATSTSAYTALSIGETEGDPFLDGQSSTLSASATPRAASSVSPLSDRTALQPSTASSTSSEVTPKYTSPRLTPKSRTPGSNSGTPGDTLYHTTPSSVVAPATYDPVPVNVAVSLPEPVPAPSSLGSEPVHIVPLRVEPADTPRRYQLYDPPMTAISTLTSDVPQSVYRGEVTPLTGHFGNARSVAGSAYATAVPPSEYASAVEPEATVGDVTGKPPSSSGINGRVASPSHSIPVYIATQVPIYPLQKSSGPFSPAASTHYTTASSCSTPTKFTSVASFSRSPASPALTTSQPINTWAVQQQRQYAESTSSFAKAASSLDTTPTEMARQIFATNSGTPVSEPDADSEFMARLERLSSVGSVASRGQPSSAAELSSYHTAQQTGYTTPSMGYTEYVTVSSMPSYYTAPKLATVPESSALPSSSLHGSREIRPVPRSLTPPSLQHKAALPATPLTVSSAGAAAGTPRVQRKPVPQLRPEPAPSPSPPPSSSSSSSSSSTAESSNSSASTESYETSRTTRPDDNMLRLVVSKSTKSLTAELYARTGNCQARSNHSHCQSVGSNRAQGGQA